VRQTADNCLEPPDLWDATEAARKLLSCIYRCERASGFGFWRRPTSSMCCAASRPRRPGKFGHENLSTFGIGADLAEAEWRLLLRQLVALHLVAVDHETFNVLRLTAASRPVLKGEQRIELRRHVARPARGKRKPRATAAPDMAAADAAAVRAFAFMAAQVARQHGVPAYVVFHDGTLRAIAAVKPQSIDALRAISGVVRRNSRVMATRWWNWCARPDRTRTFSPVHSRAWRATSRGCKRCPAHAAARQPCAAGAARAHSNPGRRRRRATSLDQVLFLFLRTILVDQRRERVITAGRSISRPASSSRSSAWLSVSAK